MAVGDVSLRLVIPEQAVYTPPAPAGPPPSVALVELNPCTVALHEANPVAAQLVDVNPVHIDLLEVAP